MGEAERTSRLVQASTRQLLKNFHSRTADLRKVATDLNRLLRFRVDDVKARDMARKFFESEETYYLAIDGTETQDQQLDFLIFYAGAFGYYGRLRFNNTECAVDAPLNLSEPLRLSAAIPIYEADTYNVSGQPTEGGVEVDPRRLPSVLMHLAEYYLAWQQIRTRPEIRVLLFDRTLGGDVGHLVWSVADHIHDGDCVLEGLPTPHGKVTRFDLELARMLHPQPELEVPAPRSQLLKYAAIALLMDGSTQTVEQLIGRLKAHQKRVKKLADDFRRWTELFEPFEKGVFGFKLKPGISEYWLRVEAAARQVCQHLFESETEYPLQLTKNEQRRWITATDIEVLTLYTIYGLLRAARERKLFLVGLIKDTGATELMRTVVPLAQSAKRLALSRSLPAFTSDKMLLQTHSVINASQVPTPWRSAEYDWAFRTMAPTRDPKLKTGVARVMGAHRNVVASERVFVKAYVQLWGSSANPEVRSHVFSYDRPAYADYDKPCELELRHQDGSVDEKIRPLLYLQNDTDISHMVMSILVAMSREVIPEALGHNYPLFLADKKAKAAVGEAREAYLSAVGLEMARSALDQQILFSARFRDYHSEVEARRRR